MTTSKDIWPVMTLFHDNNMLFIERIVNLLFSFLKVQRKLVHKVIISEDI